MNPELAKKALTEAIRKNNNRIDAVFAHNDRLAGVAADVVRELGIKNHVVIVGMNAELPPSDGLSTERRTPRYT